jgi:hypothetical protein
VNPKDIFNAFGESQRFGTPQQEVEAFFASLMADPKFTNIELPKKEKL